MRPLILIALALSGCAHPRLLQENHGSTLETTMAIQADRGRPTVANAAYTLTGEEGLLVRKMVTDQTTEEKSGEIEAVDSFKVE